MKRKMTVSNVIIVAFLLLMTALMLIPFWQIIVISLSDSRDYLLDPTHLTLHRPDFSIFQSIFTSGGILRGLLVSGGVVVMGWALSMVLTVSGGYALAHKKLPGRRFFLTMIIISMYFNGGVITMYVLLRKLGLLDTIFALFVPTACNTFHLLLVKNYMTALPAELEEAASIDGCNYIQTLIRVIIPVCKPVLLTVSMFYVVNYWNDYFSAMMYLEDQKLYPLALILRNVIISRTMTVSSLAGTGGNSPTEQYAMALIIVSMLPVIVMYPLIQKHFTAGIMMGAVKE